MKILVVAHGVGLLGGANRSLYTVLKGLKETYNVECDVLLPKKNSKFGEMLKEIGISHFSVPYFGVVSSIRKDGKNFLRKAKVMYGYYIEKFWSMYLTKKLKTEKYDLVYTNTRSPIIGALLAEKLNIPHVIHVREFCGEEPLFGKWGYDAVDQRSNRIILICDALRKIYEQHIPSEKLITIHNGIDSPLNLKPTFEKVKADDSYHIIITGRLVPAKAQLDAVKAIKKIVEEKEKRIHLHIVGSPSKHTHVDYTKKIQDYITLNQLSSYITFHGQVSDMVSLREKMDIELMCAVREAFGRVTVEGMRSGLLLIGANTGATPEIITDRQTGLLYEQGNVEDLKEKIKLAISDKECYKKMASNGYHHSQLNFIPEKNVQKVYHVFKDVLDSVDTKSNYPHKTGFGENEDS